MESTSAREGTTETAKEDREVSEPANQNVQTLIIEDNSEQNPHSGGDESEEYESANEGDTDGEAAAVEAAVAASKSLAVNVGTSPTRFLDNSPSFETAAFTTPPVASQLSSPDKNEQSNFEMQLSQICPKAVSDEVVEQCTELVEGHPAEEVESKEAEMSSTDEREDMNVRMSMLTMGAAPNPQIDENNYSSSGTEKIDNNLISGGVDMLRSGINTALTGRGDESSRTGDSTMPHSSIDEPEEGPNVEDEQNWATEDESEEDSDVEEEGGEVEVDQQENEMKGAAKLAERIDGDGHENKSIEVVDGGDDLTEDYVVVGEDDYNEEKDRQHPAYIPRQGKFFMHDVRTNEEADSEDQSNRVVATGTRAFQREWQPNPESKKWQHDLFAQTGQSVAPTKTQSKTTASETPSSPKSSSQNAQPPAASVPVSQSAQRKRIPPQARIGRTKGATNENIYPQTYEPRLETSKKRSARTISNTKFSRLPRNNVSTTEDEVMNSGNPLYERPPPWQRRAAYTAANVGGHNAAGVYPPPPGGGRRQNTQMTSSAVNNYFKYNGKTYKESDDSGYHVDDFDTSGSAYNPHLGSSVYHVQECFDDGSRHGAFLSARRQVYRPPLSGMNDSKYRKDNFAGPNRKPHSYEDRNIGQTPSKPNGDASNSKSVDGAVASYNDCNNDFTGKTFVKSKAHSRERDSKSSYTDRYSSTLERSKSLRTEFDNSARRGGKSRAELSAKTRVLPTGVVGGFEALRKDRKAQLVTTERTDSSDVDHEPKEWVSSNARRKGPEQFETPPRFERMSNSSNSSSIPVDGMMSSKKIGVTRPFLLSTTNENKEANLDSDHQIGYIASEEQDVSDSAGNTSVPGNAAALTTTKLSVNNAITNRGNKRYSAARRTSPTNNDLNDGGTGLISQNTVFPYSSSNSNMNGGIVNNSPRTNTFGPQSSMSSYGNNGHGSMNLYNMNQQLQNNGRTALGSTAASNGFYPAFMSHGSNGANTVSAYQPQSFLAAANAQASSLDSSAMSPYTASNSLMSGTNGTMSAMSPSVGSAGYAAQLALANGNPQLAAAINQANASSYPNNPSAYGGYYNTNLTASAIMPDSSLNAGTAAIGHQHSNANSVGGPIGGAAHNSVGGQTPTTAGASPSFNPNIHAAAAMYYYPAMAMAAAQQYLSAGAHLPGSGSQSGSAGHLYPGSGMLGNAQVSGTGTLTDPQSQQHQMEQLMAAMAAFPQSLPPGQVSAQFAAASQSNNSQHHSAGHASLMHQSPHPGSNGAAGGMM